MFHHLVRPSMSFLKLGKLPPPRCSLLDDVEAICPRLHRLHCATRAAKDGRV